MRLLCFILVQRPLDQDFIHCFFNELFAYVFRDVVKRDKLRNHVCVCECCVYVFLRVRFYEGVTQQLTSQLHLTGGCQNPVWLADDRGKAAGC